MKNKRGFGFLIVAGVYVLAIVCGIFIYRALPGAYWLRLLLADVGATALVFVFSVLLNNASVYDPYWSVQPIVILFAFLVSHTVTPIGAALLSVVAVWGVRLTANWAYTFRGLDCQD